MKYGNEISSIFKNKNKKSKKQKAKTVKRKIITAAEVKAWWSDSKKYIATQLAFACPKITIETLEKGVKYVQSEE